MTNKKAISALKKHLKAIGDERDKLREFKDEFDALESSCDEAYLALETAIDALSQRA